MKEQDYNRASQGVVIMEESEQNQKEELWDADPNCKHEIYSDFYGGGGIKCKKCSGWFCY